MPFAASSRCSRHNTMPGSTRWRPPSSSGWASRSALLIFAIALVWTAEGLNTALEWLCDVAAPEYHPLVKKAKDVAAAAVLLAAIGSALIGLLVFGPRLLALLDG